MRRQIKMIFLIGLGILLIACDPIIELGAAPTLTPTLAPTSTPTLTPFPTATSTPTPTFTPTVIPAPSPTISPTVEVVTLIPIMPQAAMADAPNPPPFGQEFVAYEIPTSLEDVRDFYQENLTFQGWNWVYTEIGESLIVGRPRNILVQEFRRGQIRLAIVAIDGYVFSIPPPGAVVIAATNFTGEQLMTLFTGGTLDVVYNMAGGAQEVVHPDTMQFSSPLLQFNHPSDWFPTQPPPFNFRTDVEEGAINIFEDPTRCATNEVICFINFTLLGGSGFNPSPIAIRIYSDQADSSLESFDTERWATFIEVAERQPTNSRDVYRFEDLVAPGSLELIEMKPITLQGGTPALQRIYRWRQIGLSTPLASSYTLFKRNDAIIEFHTDFTEEEWTTLGPDVQAAILSIEVVP